jgi:prefoldin subunit 5
MATLTSYKDINDKITDISTVALIMEDSAEDTIPFLASKYGFDTSSISSAKDKVIESSKKVDKDLTKLKSEIEKIESNLNVAISIEDNIYWSDEIEKKVSQKYELISGDKAIKLKNSKKITIKVKKSINVKIEDVQSEVDSLNKVLESLKTAVDLCDDSHKSVTQLKTDFEDFDDRCNSIIIFSPSGYSNSGDLEPEYFIRLKADLLERQIETENLCSALTSAIDSLNKFNKGGKNGGKNGKNKDKNKPKKLTKKRKNQLVAAIIAGKYGNGDIRKQKLKKLGYTDKQIQSIQNAINKKMQGKDSGSGNTGKDTSTNICYFIVYIFI